MPYAAAQDLLARFGAQEIAELASDDAAVTGELLELTATGGDRSGFAAEAITAADNALLRVQGRLADAGQAIDARLRQRYTLPLATTPELLVRVACDLARYDLYDDQVPDPVETRYKAALKLLGALATGSASLGMPEADATAGGGSPQILTPGRVFDDAGLRGY